VATDLLEESLARARHDPRWITSCGCMAGQVELVADDADEVSM
jgi:hypothetical protein